jgi:lipopolysaccharide/colanic/teichoic acid biosynthesis glycosyltransferase
MGLGVVSMPGLLPSSRAQFRLRLSAIDVFWAAAAAPLALFLRDALILSAQGAPTAILYCGASFVFTLIALLAFRVSAGITRYFSVHDAVSIISAVFAAGLTTTVVLFTLTRLEGIPRSIPIVQGLVLAAGLLLTRGAMRLWDKDDQSADAVKHSAVEHIIMIGSSRLTSLYIKLLQAHAPGQREIIAVLDENPKLFGRTMCGVPVVGPPEQLDSVIEEFAVHGISADRVIIGGDGSLLSPAALDEVRDTCAQRDIVVDYVPNLIGLPPLPAPSAVPVLPRAAARPLYQPSPYFRYKRVVDLLLSLLVIVLLSPVLVIASVLVLFDLGAPVVFWQKRIGRNGRSFLLYKFRTLHAPFDRHGQPNGTAEYSSWAGTFLRRLRLDELPQLFNVLVGDMSLIGPRPLLPQDQPANSALRLTVRPGITGWAQINGGNLITTEEKGALDEWYVRNASLWVDMRVVLYTLIFLFTGERRFEQAVHDAKALQQGNGADKPPTVRRPEPRGISLASGQAAAQLPVSARARATASVHTSIDHAN